MRKSLLCAALLLFSVKILAQDGLVPLDSTETYPRRFIPEGTSYAYYVSPAFSAPYALFFMKDNNVIIGREYRTAGFREYRAKMSEDFLLLLDKVLGRVIRDADRRYETFGLDGVTHYFYSSADGTAYVWSPNAKSTPGALVGIFDDLWRRILFSNEEDIDLKTYSQRLELFYARLDEETVNNEDVWHEGFMFCELTDRETGIALLQKAITAKEFEVNTSFSNKKRKEMDMRQISAISTIDPEIIAKVPILDSNYANEAFCCIGTIPTNQVQLFTAWEKLPEVRKALNPTSETAFHLCLSTPEQSDSAYVFAVNLLPKHAWPIKVTDITERGNVAWFQTVFFEMDNTSAQTIRIFNHTPNTRPALLYNKKVLVILQDTKAWGNGLIIKNLRPSDIPFISNPEHNNITTNSVYNFHW